MGPPRSEHWPPRRALPRRGADLARRRDRLRAVALYGGIYVGVLLLGGWAITRWPGAGDVVLTAQLGVFTIGVAAAHMWRRRRAFPPFRSFGPPPVTEVPVVQARWSGPLLLGAAVLYLFGLGTLRDRFPSVPNPLWVAALATLLLGAGARLARAVALDPTRVARHRRVADGARLAGTVALVLGGLSVRESAEVWTDDARAIGALALCSALVLLPFARTLRRRLVPLLRAREVVRADQRAWFAIAYPASGSAVSGDAAAAEAPPPGAL